MFEQIIDASKGKQIVMFLDYDGTLSPIVEDPDRAFMSKKVGFFVLDEFDTVALSVCMSFMCSIISVSTKISIFVCLN